MGDSPPSNGALSSDIRDRLNRAVSSLTYTTSATPTRQATNNVRDGKAVAVHRPDSREDFHRRLGTFRASRWFAKPEIVGPVQCARRGWINVDLDIIECEVCAYRSDLCLHTADELPTPSLVLSLSVVSGRWCAYKSALK
eukprot:9498480-Pyramimonas_sp.AAC.1